MKKLLFPLLLFFFVSGYSQTDTLFTRKQEKIPCKIIEINEFEIKYKLASSSDGPIYVINKSSCTKYTLSTGFTELLIPDQLLIENEHAEIIDSKSAIKIHPFSFLNSKIAVAYEEVLKVGTNLDIEVGYINTGIGPVSSSASNYSGAYLKPGVKFLIGQDFSLRGLKYAHPMKGKYIKIDLAIGYLNYQNVYRDQYDQSGMLINRVSTNVNLFSYGFFINYGRQYILGNILTLDWYIGLGYTGASSSYSNSNFSKPFPGSGNNFVDLANVVADYHGFQRIPRFGLSVTGGFRIGFILPQKKIKKPSTQIHK